MKVLTIVINSVLAVSAFGLVFLQPPVPVSIADPASYPVAPQLEFQILEVPVVQKTVREPVSKKSEESVEEPAEISDTEEADQTPVFKPVQTLEERGDAMIFEGQALLDTPFDQAITMPFDNL